MELAASPFGDLIDLADLVEGASALGASARGVNGPSDALDAQLLALALQEARRGVGRTAPNPPVGAVLARGSEVLARGFHARAGERHAEVAALDAVPSSAARGATLYVTLEPCVHHGRTPPCVDRVIAEGIARVVVGALDPNPRVHGHGIAALKAAGIEVVLAEGAVAAASRALVAPFASVIQRGRPWVTLKVAASLDGRVAAASGASRWVTGRAARGLVHALRDASDVVMVGAGTVLADDPALTVREPLGVVGRAPRDPARVVIDGALRTAPDARVYAQGGSAKSHVVHGEAPADRRRAFDDAAVLRLSVPRRAAPERVDLRALLEALAPAALTVLVEAGPGLATALWREGLVDELWWFTAPLVLGGDALPAFGPLGLGAPADAPRWRVLHRASRDDDSLLVLAPPASRAG